jgi:nuclear transport factor 2 (NTF2) superfamily protein
MIESRPPFPLFTLETAPQKVRMAEDAWHRRGEDQFVAEPRYMKVQGLGPFM